MLYTYNLIRFPLLFVEMRSTSLRVFWGGPLGYQVHSLVNYVTY